MGVGAYDTYDISMPLAMLAFKKPLFTITITNLHLRSWLLQFPGILARLHVPANPANGHNSSYTSRMGVVGAWFIWSEALSNPTYMLSYPNMSTFSTTDVISCLSQHAAEDQTFTQHLKHNGVTSVAENLES